MRIKPNLKEQELRRWWWKRPTICSFCPNTARWLADRSRFATITMRWGHRCEVLMAKLCTGHTTLILSSPTRTRFVWTSVLTTWASSSLTTIWTSCSCATARNQSNLIWCLSCPDPATASRKRSQLGPKLRVSANARSACHNTRTGKKFWRSCASTNFMLIVSRNGLGRRTGAPCAA